MRRTCQRGKRQSRRVCYLEEKKGDVIISMAIETKKSKILIMTTAVDLKAQRGLFSKEMPRVHVFFMVVTV